jgi:3-oxoadipate enol-lactonase
VPLAVSNDIQISYDDTEPGSNRFPIVFIHAFTLNRAMWDPQKQALRASNRVVTYDLRGHGRSEKPTTGYGREDEAADLAGLLKAIRASKAHLVGLSRGGGIALAFAAAHPEKTASVVAMGVGYDFARTMPEFDEQRAQTAATLRAEGLRAAREHWYNLPLFATSREEEEVDNKVDAMLIGYTGAHWLDPVPPSDPPILDAVSAISAKTLIVLGERDLPGFHTCAEELVEKIPGAKKLTISGAGHLVNLEATEQANEAIANFIA